MSPPVMPVDPERRGRAAGGAAIRLHEMHEGGSGSSDSDDWALLQQQQQQRAHDLSLMVQTCRSSAGTGAGVGVEAGAGSPRRPLQNHSQNQNQNHCQQSHNHQDHNQDQDQDHHNLISQARIQNHGSTPPDPHRHSPDHQTTNCPSAASFSSPPARRRVPVRVQEVVDAIPGLIGRSVTPDLLEGRGAPTGAAAMLDTNIIHVSRAFSPQQGSPHGDRSSSSFDDHHEPPAPPLPPRNATPTPIRPRTRTMDAAALAQQKTPGSGSEFRHRVGSVSSSGSQPVPADDHRTPISGSEAVSYSSMSSVRMYDGSTPSSSGKDKDKEKEKEKEKHKKASKHRHAVKREPSRPPAISPHPSIDSLPYPVRTEDASRLRCFMKSLGGQMRGELEYQGEVEGSWHTGIAYIDEDRGALMFVSHPAGSFHIPLVSQLRGCKVHLTGYPDHEKECIEVVPAQPGLEVLLCPLSSEEREYWLAALLCWQQLLPLAIKSSGVIPSSPGLMRPATTQAPTSMSMPMPMPMPEPEPPIRRSYASEEIKSSNVIKIGSFMLWDKGPAASASAVVRRSSTRDQQNLLMTWRRVSFALHDNGDFRLLVENSKAVLSVIELANLSRCAIQALDKTVLDEEYCIAIFPIYAANATHLSIFRPVYLALQSRIEFEVWFVLLRTFAVPDLYQLEDLEKDDIPEIADVERGTEHSELFRLEKVIRVRVTEAKIKAKPAAFESPPFDRFELVDRKVEKRVELDPLVGNYAAELILDGEVRARTMTKADTKNPFWREDCDLEDLPPTVQELSIVLKRVEPTTDAHSRAGLPQEIVCGTITIALDQLERGHSFEDWQPIIDSNQQNIGSMLVRVCHEEHVALLAKEYEPLSEIFQQIPSALTAQITALVPQHLRHISELLLNIFQSSGTASEWLMALVEDEIDGIGSQTSLKKYRFSNRVKSTESNENSTERELLVRDISKSLAGEANLLFRGNTLLTQALEFHMRRLGKEYLDEVLRDKIFEINEADPDCEVDRSKIYQTNAELDQHWSRLNALTYEVWNCIASSADRIPSELRQILKYVRAVAEDRYGDFFRTVNYTSVSGFLFLRFICPAILSPKLFGLLRDHPKPRAQRTLTLIAKTLQKLSNVSTFGKREEYMEPMNRFLNAQRKTFRNFIDQVCEIPADRGLKAVPPSYTTPLMIQNRLKPSAREGFPSLPYLIDRARSFAALVKLWVDSRPFEGVQGPPDPEVMKFHDLCVGLQKRADACLAKVEEARSKEASRKSTDHLADVLADIHEHSMSGSSLDMALFRGCPSMIGESELAPGSSGSESLHDFARGGNRDFASGRDATDGRRSTGSRHANSPSGGAAPKHKNAKMGRTLLNGIMRIGGGGRAESPESRGQR